jgi:hypothetical protein
MADQILFNGKKFLILNSDGLDYEKNVARMGRQFVLKAALFSLFLCAVPFIFHTMYDLGQCGLGVLCGIAGLVTFGLGFPSYSYAEEAYDKWIKAEGDKNIALARSQVAVYKAKEEMAKHEATMQSLAFDKSLTFSTPLEKSFVKNG